MMGLRILALTLTIFAWSGSIYWACAWEYIVSASSAHSFLYYSQTGSNGFFGPYNQSAQTDFSVANGWLGEGLGIVSGSDASLESSSATFYPTFYVNDAITVSAVYRAFSGASGAYPGAQISSANGSWLQWQTIIESPIGVMSYGKRPFGFGHGLQFDSTNRTTEHLALVADYGPMQFGLGTSLARSLVELNPNRTDIDLPFRMYWNPGDRSGKPELDIFAFLNYMAGPLEIGSGVVLGAEHTGPEGTLTDAARVHIPAVDRDWNEGWIYLHYSNGCFFFRTEADWYYGTTRYQPSQEGDFLFAGASGGPYVNENADGSGSIWKPLYAESWRHMIETGAMVGPAKLSLLYAFIPGPDRRHGVLIDRQPVIVNPYLPNFDSVVHHPDHGNAKVFRPYSTIFSSDFASGLGALDRNNEGYITDASVFAARLDYAIAANLNLFASFFKANRVSHGYGWGFIKPERFDTINLSGQRTQSYGVAYRRVYFNPPGTLPDRASAFANDTARPAIPDDDLGWEVMAGLDWRLLENFLIGVTAAYWRPGKWFNFACIDRRRPDWDTDPGPRNMWGINPDREIDGVFGLNSSIQVNF
jgi:hypothetical protein